MSRRLDLIVKGGICLTPSGRERLDIGVMEGRIVELGDLSGRAAPHVFNAGGLHVLPGVIDSQVHFREPGFPHKEDIESGSRAAVLGGVTTFFDMPNTQPLTIDEAALRDKLRRAQGRSWCNYAFYIGGCADNADHLAYLERLPGCAGIKIFMGSSTGDLLAADDETLRRILRSGRRRVTVHAEDESRLQERKQIVLASKDVRDHSAWRDVTTALQATQRILRLAQEVGRLLHILHISTAEEMELLAQWRHLATAEVLPQHLTLHAPECYEVLGTLAQMNPPIREIAHQQALWRAVAEGIVDTIGSDHAPHTREEKRQPYPSSPSGMPGVQTLLPLLLNHHVNGKLSLERLVDLTSAGPARVFGVSRKGRIAVGYDADFSVVDLKEKRALHHEDMASQSGWTPFDGYEVTGWPKATIVCGSIVMQDDEVADIPAGRPVSFVGNPAVGEVRHD